MNQNRADRLDRLFARTAMGVKPGLGATRELLAALGDPQERFLSVHVAGTNGKGSVCALLERALREMGLRTGLYTSPHLVKVHERVRMQGELISDELLHGCLDRVEAVEGSLSRPPTFFETLTAVGFLAFAESGVQVAVLETGLGGRLDCTNVVTPLAAVITRIDMDHARFLGGTLEAVAGEKAGILKPGRPAVLGAQPLEAEGVLRERAQEVGASLRLAPLEVTVSNRRQTLEGQSFALSTPEAEYGTVGIPLLGGYQVENVVTALTALECVAGELGMAVGAGMLKRAWAEVSWPARGEVVSADPPVLVDVAHNPGGAEALAGLLREVMGRRARGTFVLASLRDKDLVGVLRPLRPFMEEAFCVSVSSERSRRAEEVAAVVRAAGVPAEAMEVGEARRRVQAGEVSGAFTCVTGSVYLAGEWAAGSLPQPGDPDGAPGSCG